jgi:hypothetical protein
MPKILRGLLALLVACLSFVSIRALAGDDATTTPSNRGDLLFGKKPISSDAHRRVSALTDGRRGREGDTWKSLATVPLAGSQTYVTYDLGQKTRVVGAWLQGDNNDSYELEISSDGEHFEALWVAPPVHQPGLRTRSTKDLNAEGRYVRLHPKSGDGFFGVTELQLFSTVPADFPGKVPEIRSARSTIASATPRCCSAWRWLAPLLLYRGARPALWAIALGVAAVGAWNFAQGTSTRCRSPRARSRSYAAPWASSRRSSGARGVRARALPRRATGHPRHARHHGRARGRLLLQPRPAAILQPRARRVDVLALPRSSPILHDRQVLP